MYAIEHVCDSANMVDDAPPRTWSETLRAAAEVLNSYADRAEILLNRGAGWLPDDHLTWAHRGAQSLLDGRARELAAEAELTARRQEMWDRQETEQRGDSADRVQPIGSRRDRIRNDRQITRDSLSGHRHEGG